MYPSSAYKFCTNVYWTTSSEAPTMLWTREFNPTDPEVLGFHARDTTGHPHAWLSDRDEVNSKFLLEVGARTIPVECRATKGQACVS